MRTLCFGEINLGDPEIIKMCGPFTYEGGREVNQVTGFHVWSCITFYLCIY